MAPPIKSRNRRSSSTSSSYTSTLTTLLFIALCVLGVWMLTSNSVASPKTRSAVDTSASTTNDFSSNDEQNDRTTTTNNNDDDNNKKNRLDDSTSESVTNANNNIDDSISETTNNDLTSETTNRVFGDNPGKLPDDAIKSDDANNQERPKLQHKSSFAQNQEPRNSNNDPKNIVLEKDEVSAKGNIEDENQNAKVDQQQEVQDEANQQQLREDKGETEVMEKEQQKMPLDEPKEQENESHEEAVSVEKPKQEIKRRKSRKELKKQWSTQRDESQGEKERQNVNESGGISSSSNVVVDQEGKDFKWSICNVTAGADYIPCLDNEKYLKTSHRKHFEHRERHCPEDAPTCLVSLPNGYKTHVPWPGSRDKVLLYIYIPSNLTYCMLLLIDVHSTEICFCDLDMVPQCTTC